MILGLLLAVACGRPSTADTAALPDPECDLPLVYEKSPGDALEGPGWHRLYVHGGTASPDDEGRFGMVEHRNEVMSADHFLLSQGSLVEWTYPVLEPLTGSVFAHVARVDEPGVVARYELYLVHAGVYVPVIAVDDEHDGVQGYVPFEACFYAPAAAVEPAYGDHLLLRVTNLSGGELGIVIASPDYFTWIDVEVAGAEETP